MKLQSGRVWLGIAGALLACALVYWLVGGGWAQTRELLELTAIGDSRKLRERADAAASDSEKRPQLLILALDGVDRSLLYDLLRSGDMPNLSRLLGSEASRAAGNGFEHAFFADNMLSVLPSITFAAWTTIFTGKTPGEHGVTGNEFFVREQRRFVAPAPVTIHAPELIMSIYTDGYLNQLVETKTIYERIREKDPSVLVWVAMSQIYRGADKLILTSRVTMVDAFGQMFVNLVDSAIGDEESRKDLYATLDAEVIEEVTEHLSESAPPDILTVYLPGTDLFAHVSERGPTEARRSFLSEKVDPELGKLFEALQQKQALEDRFVVVVADHGHTEVTYDDAHALSTEGEDDPPALLRAIGRRPRPFEKEVDDDHDFDTVLAYGGAVAYVYLADPASCPDAGDRCDWKRPPTLEHVLSVADAFHRNNLDGSIVPEMKETLELIFARAPRPHQEDDLPYQVYVGDGRLMDVADFLREQPHPEYIELEKRLGDLSKGPRGERAGDVLLLARSAETVDREDRYYFASKYHSWHGSPSAQDSEIPLIVAHPQRSTAELGRIVHKATGGRPWQQGIADLLVDLRLER